jgi:23S rRNA (uracil1939-C5)-methyltransferase
LETAGFTVREVTIDRLGLSGDGLAEGLRVPFTLPGERVRGPVAEGVLAPCRHFGTCGGCALQHASDRLVADWKREVVVRALEARGLAADVPPVVVSPERSRRRAVFAGRRTKKSVLVGFHGRRSEQIVDVAECHLVRPELMAVRPALEALVRAGASRAGALRLTVTASGAGPDVEVAGGKELDPELRRVLAGLAEEHDLARLAWAGEPVAVRRPPFQTMGRARVVPPPGAFLQATAEGEAALVAAVRETVGDAGRVADLFAGCGTFALPLAEGAEVHAVEGEGAMLAALDAGWRGATGLKRVTTEARDLFRRPLLAAELKRFEAVVLDPPRAGAEAQARALAGSGVARIAMVSCNPVSFARDAAILIEGGYRLDRVLVVDQFRWSGHVELAARFDRQAS